MQEFLTINERQLLQQLSNGDSAALQTIIQSYFPLLCGFAERYLPDTSLAEDIVQETFIKLWQHDTRFESLNGLKSFLFTLTKNGCLNLQRSRGREGLRNAQFLEISEDEQPDSYYDEISRLNSIAAINEGIQQLPGKMREIFLLSYQEGLSNQEIARKLNISEKTVRNQKYNSLLILRNRFGHSKDPLFLLFLLLLK